MRHRLALQVLLLASLLVTGCGSSGGSTARFPSYAGVWRGVVELVNNTCARSIPQEAMTIELFHNVAQGMSEDVLGNVFLDVVLTDGVDTYVGIGELDEADRGDSFSTTGSPQLLPGFLEGFVCREVIDFSYEVIDFGAGDNAAATAGFVTRNSSVTCTRDTEIQTCDVTYIGSADRVSTS